MTVVSKALMRCVLSGAACLVGCAPLPTLPPPQSAVRPPAEWRESPVGRASIDARWWQTFGDPTLSRLVEAALQRNIDVFIAAARVDAARADERVARAALAPTVDVGVSAQRARNSGPAPTVGNTAEPALTASWEVDLSGRLQRLREAARLRYVASRADRDATALSVAAQTAQAYITLLSYDTQLLISQNTVRSRQEALRLADDQARVGYTSQYELTQAQSEFQSVSQEIPRLQLAISTQENALRRLTGEMPGPAERGLSIVEMVPPVVPPTLPADLLRRRPDVYSAELALAASDADLDARRAEFLPQVSLSASLGRAFATSIDPTTVWAIGGSVLAPIFSGGRLTAQVDIATAQRNEAAFSYRGTVLAAFEEVNNALSGIDRYAQQIQRVHDRRLILLRSVELARDRYQAGYAAYLEQLDAQRNLYSTELEAIALRQDQLVNIVALYKALGGGWVGG